MSGIGSNHTHKKEIRAVTHKQKKKLIDAFSIHSSVGIATGYDLEGPGSIPGRGNKFFSSPHKSRTWSGAHPASYHWLPGILLQRVKRPGLEADH
jgi:hypothetical protein